MSFAPEAASLNRVSATTREKVAVRKPSSLQYATVLSTVLSESGGEESVVGQPTKQPPSGSPISEESSPQAGEGRDVAPRKAPSTDDSGKHQKQTFSADPVRISSGFFPVSSSSSSTAQPPMEASVVQGLNPAFAIKPSNTQLLVANVPVNPSSSLSTSLRSRPNTDCGPSAAITIPARATSAERPQEAQSTTGGGLTRRNSSGSSISKGVVAAATPITISEGGGRVGKNLNLNRFGSAPVEVPFGRRHAAADRMRDDREIAWNIGEDDFDG